MRKAIFLLITGLLCLCAGILPVCAESEPNTVFVTIANGDLVLAREAVSVTDADGDGVLSLSDALYLAHEAAYDGGASAGYTVVSTEWGLSLMKLWGIENGGSYGYYLNHGSAMSLADPVKAGDTVAAFVYTDLDTFSDTYCFFDYDTVSANVGDSVTLTLFVAGFDENWAPIKTPLAGAAIVLHGEHTDFVTDENGSVTVVLEKSGEYVISAVSDTTTLVPPVCKAVVEGDGAIAVPILITACVVVVGGAVVYAFVAKKKKSDGTDA